MKTALRSIIIVAFIVFFILLNYYYLNIIYQLRKNNSECATKLAQNNQSPSFTLNDLFLLVQKNKATSQATPGNMHFTYEINKTGDEQWNILIKLTGNPGSIADAADLQLNLSNDIRIDEIIPGNAFPLYPRTLIDTNKVVITGIASVDKSSVKFGSTDTPYATLKVSKDSTQNKEQSLIGFDKENSGIYLSGKNILDISGHVDEIRLQ